MPEARLNFSDHPDSSFSCQAVFYYGYDPRSKAHQAVRLLHRYLDLTREAIHGEVEVSEVNRPTLATESFMRFTDENGSVRMQIECVPDAKSPSYQACMQAKSYFEFLHKAESDALMTRQDGISLVVGKESINERAGH